MSNVTGQDAVASCVQMQGVVKSYGDKRVLDGVDLEFPAATISAIVGASGSGKTTLLRLINALERLDSGELQVWGATQPDGDLVSYRRAMGYSVQGAGLLPHLTVYDNVTLVARLEGRPQQEIAARVQQLFARMHLAAELGERYPAELSGGQQQRVGLCRALMLKPKLLLLDEPFSAVDPITRTQLYKHFADLQEAEAVSTLLVTHDMREAARLASYIVILNEGRVAQAGATRDVLENPATSYVAALLADQLA